MVRVSVVIVNWNGSKDTIECVRSLNRLNSLNYEIIIIDNASSDSERKLLVDYLGNKCLIVELRKNLGFALANNVGILIANQHGAEFVLLLNNDTVVDPSFLDEMLIVMQKNPSAGIAGGKVLLYDKSDRIWYAGGRLNMYLRHKTEGLFQVDEPKFSFEKETDYVTGACMLIRASVFKKIGLLPREYFLGWEDIDYCFAARRSGFKCIYVPSSKIWHKASSSYKRHNSSYLQVFLGFKNRVIMRYKYLSRLQFTLFVSLQLGIIIPVHIVYYVAIYKDTNRVRNMLYGFRAGLKDRKNRKALVNI